MKLEEVLPAMREGRMAIDDEGHGWRMVYGRVMRIVKGGQVCDSPSLDGWTLEPEPKVEWPKGSLQWAETEAKRRGLLYIRRRGRSSYDVELLHDYTYSDEARHALDWEVVP